MSIYSPRDCPSFECCAAPICPLAESDQDVFYPADEEVCRGKKIPGLAEKPKWIPKVRRLRRRLVGVSEVGYFTLAMIRQLGRISARTRGIDPDGRNPQESEQTWLKKRKPIELTPQEVERRREKGRDLSNLVKKARVVRRSTTSHGKDVSEDV